MAVTYLLQMDSIKKIGRDSMQALSCKFLSVNIRGLRDKSKRLKVFNWVACVRHEAVAGIGFSDVPISNCMNYATYCLIRITIGVFYNIYTPFQQFGVLISLILP